MIEFALSLIMASSAPTLVVETLAGAVEGQIEQSISVYRGIPYAKPPIGSLRWRAPQIADRWTNKRTAHEFGAVCMQTNPKGDSGVGIEPPSEDCLTLNIWTPPGGAAQRPVMIWIHGGGYISGSGSAPLYDGSALAARGVVVVTFNYRLGRFGFFDHPELATFNEGANFGLLDQRAAFQWVRDNIEAFGGDPNQITLFGNSAGGESILFHMTSPVSRGLFHRAIVQSGLGGRDLLNSSSSVDRECASTPLTDLRALKPSDIISWGTPSLYRGFGPTIDGISINSRIEDAFREQRQERIPLIIGYNSFEIPPASIGGTKVALALVGHDEKQRASGIEAYGAADLYEQKVASDALFRMPALRLARLHARAGHPTWAYELGVVAPSVSARLKGAPHASERAYVFNTLQSLGWATDMRDVEIARERADRWVAFARTSNAATRSAPWPRLKRVTDILSVTRDGKPRDMRISPTLSRYFRLP